MALQGNLEDLPLLDIIQIVSFSKKTGYLSIETEGGGAAIVFREGLVVAAFAGGSPPADRRLASLPEEAREKAVRARLGFALEQLARLREGGFAFELTEDVPAIVGSRVVGIVLTGMGSDGTEGLRAIRRRGGRTLAESEETCVIYGMPKAAIEAGVVERTCPLDRIAGEILGAV